MSTAANDAGGAPYCRHCRVTRDLRSRGLCFTCYGNRSIRMLYPLVRLEHDGDPAAPLGSRPWAAFARETIRQHLEEVEGDCKSIREYTKLFIEHKAWQSLDNSKGEPFSSYESFCRERKPFGLGRHPEEIETVIAERERKRTAQAMAADREVKPLADHGEVGKGRNRGNNVNSKPAGNQVSYLVRRLKRDAPEIAEALGRGEFKSARAAAKAAGVRVTGGRRRRLLHLDAMR